MLTLDSNVQLYATDRLDPNRQTKALELIRAADYVDTFLTQQALGEFCNVALRKQRAGAAIVRRQVEAWTASFALVPTRLDQLLASAELAERRRKQFWDMVLVQVAADAGATTLLNEDIGDGEVIAGVRIVNPFAAANATRVAARLTPAS